MIELETLSSLLVTGRCRSHSGQYWCWFHCRLSVSVRWRCTQFFAPPGGLQILPGAIVARKLSVRGVLTKNIHMSLYCSLHLSMPSKLNTPHLPFSDFGTRSVDQILHFLYRCVRKPSLGHFVHTPIQVHVGLFQLYLASLPCDSSRHVENRQEISCCF